MKPWLGALVLLAASLVLRMEYVVYAMYAFLALLGLSRYGSLRWLGQVTVHRQCSRESAEIGERASVTLAVRNTGRSRIPWMLIEEGQPAGDLRQHPPRLRTGAPPVSVAALRPGEVRDLSYEVEFLQRGYYPFGPLLLESGDLFGLDRRYRVTSDPCYVLVRPKVIPLLGYDLASRRPVGEVRISHRFFEDPTLISGIRPYEKGDPLHRIHWRATARTGALHCKVYQPSCIAGATLLLDFHRAGYLNRRHRPVLTRELTRQLAAAGASDVAAELEGPDPAWVELAVTTVASLANAVSEQGQQVGFVSNGRDAADRIRSEGCRQEFRSRTLARENLDQRSSSERLQPVVVETRRDPGQLGLILDALARLELTDGLPFPDLVAEVSSRLPRDATVAAVLSEVSEEAAITLGNLRRSGFAVTAVLVSLEENDLHDWASAPEWADRLITEGIAFRRVQDEASLERLCAEHFVR